MKFFDIIKSQVVTEKSQAIESIGNITKYTFKILPHYNKVQVKEAFKQRFNHIPDKVNIINVKHKKKKFKNRYVSFVKYKKAIVTFNTEVNFALDEKVY